MGPLLGRDEKAFEERHPERQSRKPIATAGRDPESRHCYGAASFQSTRPASATPRMRGRPSEAAPASCAHALSRSAAEVEAGARVFKAPARGPFTPRLLPRPDGLPESARFPERQVKFPRMFFLFWFTKVVGCLSALVVDFACRWET